MRIYLVGGAVRDQLLGRPIQERDWVVVGASPDEMTAQGYRQVGRDFPVFLHPDSHEEYALARTERKVAPGHRGFQFSVERHVTLKEDLQRRDLTLNAMAQDDDGVLVDPYGGQSDLEARKLRHVSPAFSEDPLRILRVARFAAQLRPFGFQVADETQALMRRMARDGELKTLTAERVFKEFRLALNTSNPEVFITTLDDCEAWPVIFPLLPDPKALCTPLRHAVDAGLSDAGRFACISLHSDDAIALCNALRTPRAWLQLCTLLQQQLPAWQALTLPDVTAMVQLIEKTDGIRKPERFADFCAAARTMKPIDAAIEDQLHRVHTVVLNCDVRAAVEQEDERPVRERVTAARLAAAYAALGKDS